MVATGAGASVPACAHDPISIRWTLHALDKAQQLGFARHDVESALLEHHRERRRNAGRARWRVIVGRMVVAYEHTDRDDPLVARVVRCGGVASLWT